MIQYDMKSTGEDDLKPAAPVFSSEARTGKELLKEIRSRPGAPQLDTIIYKVQNEWMNLEECLDLPEDNHLQIRSKRFAGEIILMLTHAGSLNHKYSSLLSA